MTDHLDLEAIKERVAQLWPTAEYVDDGIADAGADCRALISEVELLRADFATLAKQKRCKDEALREVIVRLHVIAATNNADARSGLAEMASQIALRAFSESPTEEGRCGSPAAPEDLNRSQPKGAA